MEMRVDVRRRYLLNISFYSFLFYLPRFFYKWICPTFQVFSFSLLLLSPSPFLQNILSVGRAQILPLFFLKPLAGGCCTNVQYQSRKKKPSQAKLPPLPLIRDSETALQIFEFSDSALCDFLRGEYVASLCSFVSPRYLRRGLNRVNACL